MYKRITGSEREPGRQASQPEREDLMHEMRARTWGEMKEARINI